MVTIAQRGLPSAVRSIVSMSSGAPLIHAPNDGEASRPLSRIANAVRSFGGKNASSSNTPSLRIGGVSAMPDQRGQVEAAALLPLVHDQVAEQDVLAARQRIGIDADEAEQTAHEPLDLVADGLGVAHVGRRLRATRRC